jgi:hypothetical protein
MFVHEAAQLFDQAFGFVAIFEMHGAPSLCVDYCMLQRTGCHA